MKRILILIVTIFSLNSFLQAQDDPNVGFYVDGVKVVELNCYSFKKLSLVLPYNPAYANYDKFKLSMDAGDNFAYGFISKGLMTSKANGKYFVYDLLVESPLHDNLQRGQEDAAYYFTRGVLAFYSKKSLIESTFKVTLSGLTVSGTTETFDQGCSCYKKVPQYSSETLTEIKVTIKNRKSSGGAFGKEPKDREVDMSQPCTYPGTKVDFNSLGSKSSGNSNTKTPADKKATKEKEDDDDKDDKDDKD